MKIIISIILTIIIMLQLFYYAMLNANTYFGHDIEGNIIVGIDLGVQRFNYCQHEKNDKTLYDYLKKNKI